MADLRNEAPSRSSGISDEALRERARQAIIDHVEGGFPYAKAHEKVLDALRTVRDEAYEAAAKIADGGILGFIPSFERLHRDAIQESVSQAIRSLKGKP